MLSEHHPDQNTHELGGPPQSPLIKILRSDSWFSQMALQETLHCIHCFVQTIIDNGRETKATSQWGMDKQRDS